jgi:hypothetical protein
MCWVDMWLRRGNVDRRGVRVGHERADMNEKGRVGVNGGPPDLVGVVV